MNMPPPPVSGESRSQDIFLHLKSCGLEVYFPGQHVGHCLSEYVVVRESNTSRIGTLSSTRTYYDILCYIPQQFPARVETFKAKVKESMRGLWPMITPAYSETAQIFDNEVKAHMVSVMYQNYKYIEGGR